VPVRLVVEDGPYMGVSRVDVVRRARAMLAAVQMLESELSIVLTGDHQIRKLNRIYRKKNRPTDVLAFAQRDGEMGRHAGRLLGDVVLSVPTARRQAEAAGRDLGSELTMLLAHGLLHLLGWDHDTAAKDRRMRHETERLCAAADAAARAPRAPGARRATAARVKARTTHRPNADSIARRAARTAR
jgi:probable rRNA maturation factor